MTAPARTPDKNDAAYAGGMLLVVGVGLLVVGLVLLCSSIVDDAIDQRAARDWPDLEKRIHDAAQQARKPARGKTE